MASRALVTTAILLLGLPVARAGCVAPYWEPTTLTNRAAISLVAADLDGDGKADIAGITTTTAFVLRNDGTGKFGGPVDVYSGALHAPILAGDFNGDGHVDLAFARDGALVVLRGKGDGTFGTPIESAIGINVTALVAARFDGDNALDLVALDAAAAQLTIFRNSGSGTFTAWQSLSVRPNARVMAAADLDGDGKSDVVVAYWDSASFDAFYGGSDGKLASPVTVAGELYTAGLQAADMNGDGLLDLVIASSYGDVSVIRNLGGRSFGDPLTYTIENGDRFNALGVADLTGHGGEDVLMSDPCGIFAMDGLGNGTLGFGWFSSPQLCGSATANAGSVATADFDGDGRIDVVGTFPANQQPMVIEFRNHCGDDVVVASTESPTISLGQTVTIIGSVIPPLHLNFFLVPSGNVSLFEGDRLFGSAPIKLQSATFSVAGLALGDHTFTAEYPGDPQYNAGRSAPLTVHVTTATTTTVLTVDPPVGVYGTDPKVTATVTSSTGDTPTGPIRFTIDGTRFNIGETFIAPKATVDPGGPVGIHTYVADFVGDATHPPSRASMTYVINKQTPSLDVLKAFAVTGSTGTIAVFLGESGQGNLPTGTLTLRNGDKVIGAQHVDGPEQLEFSVPALDAGRYTFRVTYSGDGNYAAVDTIAPYVVFPVTPSIDARGTAAGVTISWNAPNQTLARAKAGGPWTSIVFNDSPPYFDKDVVPGIVYLYRSQANDGTNVSNVDTALIFPFTDDPLLPERSVTSLHVAEVVQATNILRAAAGLQPVTLPAVTAGPRRRRVVGAGSGVPASDVLLLRDAINEARGKLGAYPFDFATPVSPSLQINASQLQELREAIR